MHGRRRTLKRSDVLDIDIVNLYNQGFSVRAIGKSSKCSDSTVRNRLARSGITELRTRAQAMALLNNISEYKNLGAFADKNSSSMYWAGFIMADGSIKNSRKSIMVNLRADDFDHLVKLSKFLGADESRVSKYHARYKSMGEIKTKPACTISIVGNVIYDIAVYGVIEGKHLRKASDDACISVDFWRGVFDGDGHIRKKDLGAEITFCSKDLSIQFSEFCEQRIGITPYYSDHVTKFRSLLSGDAARNFLKLIYQTNGPALDRKKDFAIWMLENGPKSRRRHIIADC